MNDWTEEHYFIYGLLEEVLGNRESSVNTEVSAAAQAIIDGKDDWDSDLDDDDADDYDDMYETSMTEKQNQEMETLHKEVFGGS